ncbi:MAG: NFACT RNA binding domain-containing protein, partial [Gemmatimonadota bacterium]
DAEAALAALARRRDVVLRRLDRLRGQLDGATADAERARRHAGLLLSQARSVGKGRTEAFLDDYEGGRERVELDPALDAAGNAERLYHRARRRDRAARRIPPMIRAGEREAERLSALDAAIRSGEATPDSVPRVLTRMPGAKPGRKTALPFRRYRSRNGLEIRVGRSARANDELTMRHCRPDDIWMHARDVAGAHVVLVWGRRDQNPPEADVRDAAGLAALYSRARTSGTVAVDWTRRKYVRKPRKAPPGTVLLERGKTLFVEPDPALEERLKEPGAQP